jgi:acid phosphatase (class A)
MLAIMKTLRVCAMWVIGAALLVASGCVQAQTTKPAKPAGTPQKTAYYIDPTVLNLTDLVPDAPAVGSMTQKEELRQLHEIERTRTPEQVAAAKVDEDEEDIFLYKTVLGAGFSADALPLTAALGTHVKNDQSVVGAMLKPVFQRQRPYQTDATLHPPCALTEAPNSYPSGHALTGYMEGLTLAEIVPEKRTEILARADEYARNRLVCGVHHSSDIEASRTVAYMVFGYMLATPRFQRDLAAAKFETRAKLGLSAKPGN